MDQLKFYGSDSDSSSSPPRKKKKVRTKSTRQSIYSVTPLPPPELEKIPNAAPPNFKFDHGGRTRSFAHVEGNFPLHISIPVPVTLGGRNILEVLLGKASAILPQLRGMDDDVVATVKRRDSTSTSNAGSKIQICKQYHISISRTVAIRIHQIESIVPMLRHKFQGQKRFWIEFGRWEVFLNDERTRSFLALEIVSAGLSEIRRQVSLVNEVYKLHGLPPFYEAPRPHISLAWALGDVTSDLQKVADELNELCGNGGELISVMWSHLFARVECKIGQQMYPVWVASSSSHT